MNSIAGFSRCPPVHQSLQQWKQFTTHDCTSLAIWLKQWQNEYGKIAVWLRVYNWHQENVPSLPPLYFENKNENARVLCRSCYITLASVSILLGMVTKCRISWASMYTVKPRIDLFRTCSKQLVKVLEIWIHNITASGEYLGTLANSAS